jgi:hypothetical protein
MPGDHARWYRIVVRGEVGSLLAASLGETEIEALDQGVTIDEIAGVLMALLPTVGTARVTAAHQPSALRLTMS